jgi:hypothetical protein
VAKKETFNSPSIVFLKFVLESGDFIPFVQKLMASESYIDSCYDKMAIIYNTYYRDDLLSELMLLGQVKFDFGYVPRQQQQQTVEVVEQKNGISTTTTSTVQKQSELLHLKQVSKALVQFFIKKKTEDKELDLVCIVFIQWNILLIYISK